MLRRRRTQQREARRHVERERGKEAGQRGMVGWVVLVMVLVGVLWGIRGSIRTTAAQQPRLEAIREHGVYGAPSTPLFSSLPAIQRPAQENPVSVCIMTYSFVGPTKNGGIATAQTALAEALVSDGAAVTVLYLWGPRVQYRSIKYWVEHYAAKGIALVPLRGPNITTAAPSEHAKVAYQAFQWLRVRQFDVVHVHEWHGPAYYIVRAKRQGSAFQRTSIITTIHCPSLFYLFGSGVPLQSKSALVSDFLERKQVEFSDVVISPSQYMLNWVQHQGWTLPDATYVQQNMLPLSVIIAEHDTIRQDIDHLVFFGRLEVLKGLDDMCDALDHLTQRRIADAVPFSVTFLGSSNVKGGNATARILQRQEQGQWPFKVTVESNLLQPEAVAFLQYPGRLAVIPSRIDNSPYAVLECLALGVPFIASNVGGISELIEPEHRSEVLFEPTPAALADQLQFVLERGAHPVEPRVSIPENRRSHLAFTRGLVLPHTPAPSVSHPLVSICVVHHDRPHVLGDTLDALLQQNYPNLELILVDNGSRDQQALDHVLERLSSSPFQRIRVLRQGNLFPGAARNAAVDAAVGEYVAFMDDDDIPKKHWVSRMVEAAQNTKADVVTCMVDFVQDDLVPQKRWLVLGDAVGIGMLDNIFGAYAALFRTSVFRDLNGFTTTLGSTFEDYELFAHALLSGYTLELVADPLILYRQHASSHLMKSTQQYHNRLRGLRPYLGRLPPSLQSTALYLYAKGKKGQSAPTNAGNGAAMGRHHVPQ